jgi:hypothetical protein
MARLTEFHRQQARARWSEAIARSQESDGSGSESDERKTKGEWCQPRLGPPYLYGVHRIYRCGSFRRTTRLNGSIPRSSREDKGGFFANRLQRRPKF